MAAHVNKQFFHFSSRFSRFLLDFRLNLSNSGRNYQPKTKPSHSVKQYLQSKQCLRLVADFLPEQFLRVKIVPAYYTFVVDDETAGDIVDLIKHHITGGEPVIEVYPGLGLLTRRLLLAGAEKVLVFDPRPISLPPLLQLVSDNPQSITVIPSLFYDLPLVIGQDLKDGGDRFDTIFKDVPSKEWSKDPACKLVGVLHHPQFLRYLAKSICFQWPIIRLGRIDMFFLMTDGIQKKILEKRQWGKIQNSILLRAFFNVEVLGEFPRKAFVPWDRIKKGAPIEERVTKLVRVTPKSDIFLRYSPDQLKVLWFFIHELARSKENFVIAVFEKWVPSSGLRLILEGLNMSTRIKDLSIDDVLNLFEIFISLPQFDESEFIHIQETNQLNDADESQDETDQSQQPKSL